jgi:signal transduction histidine kinase/CheY-like chemotaxis protein
MPSELLQQYEARIAELETELAAHRERLGNDRTVVGTADIRLPVEFALDAAGIGLFNVDIATQTVHMSPGACRLFGLEVRETYPANSIERMVVDSQATPASNPSNRADGSAPLVVTYKIARADDGEHRWIERRARLKRDEDGVVTDFGGAMRDVTDLRTAMDFAARSHASVTALLESRNFLIDLTARQRALSDPDTVMRMTAQLLGERLSTHRVGFYRVLSSSTNQYLNGWSNGPLPLLSGILPFGEFGQEAEEHRSQGKILAFTDSRHDLAGRVHRFSELGVLSGVEVPLLSNGRWYAGFFVHSAMVRAWSAADISFIREVAELAWLAVERAEAYVRLGDQVQRQAETIESGNQEAKGQREQRLAAESKVRQLQKLEAVGQLTGGIAHDFNNMLAIIVGALTLMQRKLKRGDTDLQKNMESAMDGAKRATGLTARLLAFSRQQPLSPSPLDANRLVADLSDMLARTLGESIHLEVIQGAGLWNTLADANQLENVLINLCINARDAMEQGGSLTVETANVHVEQAYALEYELQIGQYVVISVSDTGTGMTPEVMSKAFEPFFTTKGIGKGSGLGLSQAFGFASQSGGHLKVYSEVGHGTTFKLYLPRYFGKAAERVNAPARHALRQGRFEEIIMVVEDEDRMRAVASEILRELGYTVIHAANGPEALALINAGQDVTLLFTDIVMPEMSGRVLADLAVKKLPHLKVIYTTGYTRNAVVHNGTLDPGTNFLPKPYSIEELSGKIADVLDAGA